MLEIVRAILFGIIQGITEWLPISSTAHLILFEKIWSINNQEFFNVFKVVIQFGSILAVVVLYYKRLNPFISTKTEKEKRDIYSLWSKIIIGSIPAGITGLLLDDLIDDALSGVLVIATTLLVYGIAFIILESTKRKPRILKLEQLDYKTAFGIGCFQVLALIPGTSRSGSTILGGSLLGCSRTVASEFSFFLAVPIMAAASLLKLIKYGFAFSGQELVLLFVGTFVSFVVSVIAIRFLLSYIRKHDFKVFGYYRIILAIILFLTLI